MVESEVLPVWEIESWTVALFGPWEAMTPETEDGAVGITVPEIWVGTLSGLWVGLVTELWAELVIEL